ncbi:MAG: helix-turn-helix domain-containing protein, partial [Lachnospiraceae bacterium]|nr:helix-turn-helix domain-containing protein [Lachnospiraceae bacterium]
MIDYRANLRKEVRKRMKEKHWTQKRMAIECGVSLSEIEKILYSGTGLLVDTLLYICEKGGVSLTAVFELQNAMTDEVIKEVLRSVRIT